MTHNKGDEKESFVEVMNQIFIPGQTTWSQLAGVCERAGLTDLATALLDSYSTGQFILINRLSNNYTRVII